MELNFSVDLSRSPLSLSCAPRSAPVNTGHRIPQQRHMGALQGKKGDWHRLTSPAPVPFGKALTTANRKDATVQPVLRGGGGLQLTSELHMNTKRVKHLSTSICWQNSCPLGQPCSKASLHPGLRAWRRPQNRAVPRLAAWHRRRGGI